MSVVEVTFFFHITSFFMRIRCRLPLAFFVFKNRIHHYFDVRCGCKRVTKYHETKHFMVIRTVDHSAFTRMTELRLQFFTNIKTPWNHYVAFTTHPPVSARSVQLLDTLIKRGEAISRSRRYRSGHASFLS